ncbi:MULTISPECIES: chromate efflux transporter [Sphingobium]|uniref:chromate efflux transporter n=1 Tax=Sphingobium TaxID=165695 RepID=UPI0013774F96|nr:chromate efflux transporter [Sphingobium yanoikuyae]
MPRAGRRGGFRIPGVDDGHPRRGEAPEKAGSAGEVFRAFLKLGVTSFGGPVAHLGYFRDELVLRRRWLDERSYAETVALCQFLPGPASSQVGFALGLQRAGFAGALAAWSAFTLPSAIILFVFAYGAGALNGPLGQALVHGLKLVAVPIVAHAIWGMARSLTPDLQRATIAVAALVLATFVPTALGQVGAIAAGGAVGLWLCRNGNATVRPTIVSGVGRRVGLLCLAAFAALLVGLPLAASSNGAHGLALFDSFYRAGALVFGGGHVVLPLLEAEVVTSGWISEDGFLAGYGAAQAIPGPLFTFASYLGAVSGPEPNGAAGATIALVAIFLPGLLLLVGALPFWTVLRGRSWAQAALAGTNAAVVGILSSAFLDPVWSSAIEAPSDVVIAAAGLVALSFAKIPAWGVVAGVSGASVLQTLI